MERPIFAHRFGWGGGGSESVGRGGGVKVGRAYTLELSRPYIIWPVILSLWYLIFDNLWATQPTGSEITNFETADSVRKKFLMLNPVAYRYHSQEETF